MKSAIFTDTSVRCICQRNSIISLSVLYSVAVDVEINQKDVGLKIYKIFI